MVHAAAENYCSNYCYFIVFTWQQNESHASGLRQGRYLIPVEPQAAKATQYPSLQKGYPAGVQLHDDCKGAVGCQDDVVNHGGVVANPDIVGPVDWSGAMVANHTGPGSHKHAALKLDQCPLPGCSAPLVLQSTASASDACD